MSIRLKVQNVLDRVNDEVSAGTITTSDQVTFVDTSDSNAAKRATVSALLALVSGGSGITFTFGTSFPSNPNSGDIFQFSADVASGLSWLDTDGTTSLTAADEYDIARYDGTNWVKQLDFDGFVTDLNDFTTATPTASDVLPFIDVSASNGNRKATVDTMFDLQNAVDDAWLTSADFADGSLADTGTLEWTAAADAPSGAVDGNSTQCHLPKSNEKPHSRIIGLWVALRDGDSSDAVQSEQFIPWLQASPDLVYQLHADDDAYAEFTIELGDTDQITPVVTVTTTQDAGNTLTGMFLTISPAVIG